MVNSTISISDPLRLNPPPAAYQVPYNDTRDRPLVSPYLVPGEKTLVIVTQGQSLLANYTQGPYTIVNSTKVHNLNIVDGGLYAAQNTLLGIDGTLTSVATRFADLLITYGNAQRVILVPISVGGSDVAQWGLGGVFNQRMGIAMRRLASIGLKPTHIVYQQGTSDNSLNTSAAAYQTYGQQMIDTWRALGADCPIFIGKESWVSGDLDQEVRAGQAALVNPSAKVYAGPDFDTITARYDAAHPDTNGGNQAMLLTYNAVAPLT